MCMTFALFSYDSTVVSRVKAMLETSEICVTGMRNVVLYNRKAKDLNFEHHPG